MIKPTMFQCMVTTNGPVRLKPMFDRLCQHEKVTHIYAKVPGSLGQSVRDVSGIWKIGSLDMKVLVNDLYVYSVFVFENGKIKISGGSRAFKMGEDYDTWLETDVVVPILTTLNLHETSHQTQLFLLNGSYTLPSMLMNLSNYRLVCDRIAHDLKEARFALFDHLTLPSRLMLPKKRGRICSLSVKYKNGTLRFDHGGKVQLFAFKSIDDMDGATQLLVDLLETVNLKI